MVHMRRYIRSQFAFGIPCIGYKGLDTQQTLHPQLSVEIGDIEQANSLAIKLRDDKEFYNYSSQNSMDNYKRFYTENVWLQNWKTIYEQIKN